MQIQTEHGGAAGDEIAFVPAGKITAGVELQQRIAIPDRRCDQQKRDGDRDGSDQGRTGLPRA
jgi:hypothetical protein